MPPRKPETASKPSATALRMICAPEVSSATPRDARQINEATNAPTTVRFNTMCRSPVENAFVPRGIVNRSRRPKIAASNAPAMPTPTAQYAPRARPPGKSADRDPMSSTRLVTHAPIGTVTRIGWNGCPYGPAATLTGLFAANELLVRPAGSRTSDGVDMPHPQERVSGEASRMGRFQTKEVEHTSTRRGLPSSARSAADPDCDALSGKVAVHMSLREGTPGSCHQLR